jgi:lauroyl/myristoyl acyltransferase
MVYRLALLGTWLARWCSPRIRHALGALVGEIAYWGWASKRRITQENMAVVLNQPPSHPLVRRLARASWRNYGRYIADFFDFPNRALEEFQSRLVDMTPHPQGYLGMLKQAHAGKRGVVITTAHFGNWDVGGAIFASGEAFSVIAEKFADPRLDHLIQGQRAAKGMHVIPMEGTARRVFRALLRRETVAILADRPLTERDGVAVTFFGRRTYVPSGPAQLALKTGSALVGGFCWYAPNGRFYGLMTEPITYEPTGDQHHDVQVLTQRVYRLLETMIRAYPEQWYMFRPFWPSSHQQLAK